VEDMELYDAIPPPFLMRMKSKAALED